MSLNITINSYYIHFTLGIYFKKEIRNVLEQSQRMWAEIKMQNHEILKRLEKLEKKGFAPLMDDLLLSITSFLPLTSIVKVDDFNSKLRDNDNAAILL